MVLVNAVGSEARFAAYVESLASVIGHKDRIGPLRDYWGLRAPARRSTVPAGTNAASKGRPSQANRGPKNLGGSLRGAQIVPPWSGAKYFGEPLKVPHSNHITISKPASSSAIQHRLLVDFINQPDIQELF